MKLYAQGRGYNKNTYPDLPAVVVDQALSRLHRSLSRFFIFRKRGVKCGFPRFKSESQWHNIEFRDTKNYLRGGYFHAGKICGGNIRTIVHRPLEGTFKFGRIIKRPSGWYLQCVCEVEAKPLEPTGKSIGLDMGIKSLVADSEGVITSNPKHLQAELKNLAHSQRILSRRRKGSNRYKKQANVVARRHERIANRRRDFLHKLTRRYVNQYDTIVVEDLNVAGMIQNHRLARAISDASWSMFRQLLTEKAESAGRKVIAVPAHFTSQLCSECGAYVQKSLSIRTHVCPNCGYVDDRDVNAAKNILRKGLDKAIGECST
jgi:putative transposase